MVLAKKIIIWYNIFDNSFVKEIFPMDCWWNICTYEKLKKKMNFCVLCTKFGPFFGNEKKWPPQFFRKM